MFETAIAAFFAIITVDMLAILIRLDTIRHVAKKNMIPITRRVDANTAYEDASLLELADELKISDRTGKGGT